MYYTQNHDPVYDTHTWSRDPAYNTHMQSRDPTYNTHTQSCDPAYIIRIRRVKHAYSESECQTLEASQCLLKKRFLELF